jgi:hypothetical protein
MTWTMPIVAPGWAGRAKAAATPGVRATVAVSEARACWSAFSATSCSGPLKPGPNPSLSRSYALRVVLAAGSLPWSEEPSRSDSTGAESASMMISATAARGLGCRSTKPAQRAQKPLACTSCGPSKASRRRSRRLSTRVFMKPSIAGSRVIAASTLNSTISAAETPMPLRKLTLRMNRPSIATQTVSPAKMTARPEVFSARTVASSGSSPAFRPLR